LAGTIYAFGLGTGGRLGTGYEHHRPLPTLIQHSLHHKKVTCIAAAINHLLCCIDTGDVYAWGSNRFGQLGFSSKQNSSNTANKQDVSNHTASHSLVPKRVGDLKK